MEGYTMEMLLFRTKPNTEGISALGISVQDSKGIGNAGAILTSLIQNRQEELSVPISLPISTRTISDAVFNKVVAVPEAGRVYRVVIDTLPIVSSELGSRALFDRSQTTAEEVCISISSNHMPRNREFHIATEAVTLAEIVSLLDKDA